MENEGELLLPYIVIRRGRMQESIDSLFAVNGNKLIFNEYTPFYASGTYELTITLSPAAKYYISTKGESVPFPQFEPVTETFEIDVGNTYRMDVSDYSEQEHFEAALTEKISTFSEDLELSLYGETSLTYNDLCAGIKTSIDDSSYNYGIDLWEVKTSSAEGDAREIGVSGVNLFKDVTNITSFAAPKDAVSVGFYAFSGCTNLEYVKLGSEITNIAEAAFSGCSKLAKLEIPKDSSLKTINQSAFSNTALTSFVIPKNVIAISAGAFDADCTVTLASTEGQWYAIGNGTHSGQDLWTALCSNNDTDLLHASETGYSIEYGTDSALPILPISAENFSTYIDNYYYLYCVKIKGE